MQDHATQRLTERLEELPADVFEKIRTTVNGDDDILVGTWIEYANGKLCGCLMCDGVTREQPEGWDLTEMIGADSEAVQDMLFEFYNGSKFFGGGVNPVDYEFVQYDRLPRAFDAWAGALELESYRSKLVGQRPGEAGYDMLTTRVLTEGGREELREIIESVVSARRRHP